MRGAEGRTLRKQATAAHTARAMLRPAINNPPQAAPTTPAHGRTAQRYIHTMCTTATRHDTRVGSSDAAATRSHTALGNGHMCGRRGGVHAPPSEAVRDCGRGRGTVLFDTKPGRNGAPLPSSAGAAGAGLGRRGWAPLARANDCHKTIRDHFECA
jgi:hypothetical protein